MHFTHSHSAVQKRPARKQLQYSFRHRVLEHVQCVANEWECAVGSSAAGAFRHGNDEVPVCGLMNTDWISWMGWLEESWMDGSMQEGDDTVRLQFFCSGGT